MSSFKAWFIDSARGLLTMLSVTLAFGISIGIAGQSSFNMPRRMDAVERSDSIQTRVLADLVAAQASLTTQVCRLAVDMAAGGEVSTLDYPTCRER